MYTIHSCSNTVRTVKFPVHLLKDTEVPKDIQFGVSRIQVDVVISDEIEGNQITISNDVQQALELPLSCQYELRFKNGVLVIGPFIGILAEVTDKKLEPLLRSYTSFVKGYEKIGGAIMVFSLSGINEEDRRISGYLYDPSSKKWRTTTLPYPSSILSIIEASLTSDWSLFQSKMEHLLSVLGPRVFNFPHFSKWEMHNILSPKLSHSLPDTICYQDPVDVLDMVIKHGNVYVKPINGRLGRKIYRIIKAPQKIAVEYTYRKKNRIKYFTSNEKFLLFIKEQLIPKAYLIQEAIPLMIQGDRVIDFRMIMVKNELGKWENIGIFSRFGKKGSIVSNISSGGHTELAELTLQTIWKLSNEEINEVKRNMLHIANQSLQLLEEQGYHFGNIGFDLGLEANRKIYIIEINHQNPDPYIALFAKEKGLFYLTRFKNMMYAKKLAGF
ncbi:glutathione synthase/RimK-type ligase-like ATP-grasp enzyme [Bacillus mesophilus]|uniref:YheC/YheD family protein n=1 Tax=Bacillus mesophilus TaxID=1808955 RepID=A0A6M0QAL2_9BACI|nr:YheC/YheD family protein [Bacillus mesophilus]MBM7662841.1 glutathione synthase/RimK-type ligase-like ATP-grasp enzyme [Bacillus mesophilus]NEY73431.1 YheC/YheD family protein [Bacillus mesophilus]